jgi:chromosome segregation ATPase
VKTYFLLTTDHRPLTTAFSLALARGREHNRASFFELCLARKDTMAGLTGLEKFSHLEDKIYRTIELTKTLRQEKESLEREVITMRRELGLLLEEKDRLETQNERLLNERDTIRLKVEAMLDALAVFDPEMVEAMRR